MKRNFLLLGLLAIIFSFSACSDDDDNSAPIIDPEYPYTEGFFILNEGWFSHDNGTVTFINNDDSIDYRVYRSANSNDSLGVTSQYATIFRGNAYIVSKQGTRLVVADAKTMKSIARIENLGGGDGRAFVGINSNLGYISTSTGIVTFDISTNTVGEAISGINEEVGDMCLGGNYVFAIANSGKVYIINTADNTLKETLSDNTYFAVVKSKDGNIMLGASGKFVQVDPTTLSQTELVDANIKIATAWTSHSLSASIKNNVLYWRNGEVVYKYSIDTNTVTTDLYTLSTDEEGKSLAFYGTGLKLNPTTDQLILTVIRSSSFLDNWVYILDNNGNLVKKIAIKGGKNSSLDNNYYWFPAMPFFHE